MTHSTLLGIPCLLFLYLLGNYVNYQGQVSAEVVGNRIMRTTSEKDIPKYMLDIMRREGRSGTVVGRKVIYQRTTHGKSVRHGAMRGRKVFYKVVRHGSSGGTTGGRGKVVRKVIRHGTPHKTGGTIIHKIIRRYTSGVKNVPHKSGGKISTEVYSQGKSSKTGRKVRASKDSEMHKAIGEKGEKYENIHHFLPEYEATSHGQSEGRGHLHHFLPDHEALSTWKKRSKNRIPIPKSKPESRKDDDDDDDDDE